jgi:hypothetical protein
MRIELLNGQTISTFWVIRVLAYQDCEMNCRLPLKSKLESWDAIRLEGSKASELPDLPAYLL